VPCYPKSEAGAAPSEGFDEDPSLFSRSAAGPANRDFVQMRSRIPRGLRPSPTKPSNKGTGSQEVNTREALRLLVFRFRGVEVAMMKDTDTPKLALLI
jgi:hypothetical protein